MVGVGGTLSRAAHTPVQSTAVKGPCSRTGTPAAGAPQLFLRSQQQPTLAPNTPLPLTMALAPASMTCNTLQARRAAGVSVWAGMAVRETPCTGAALATLPQGGLWAMWPACCFSQPPLCCSQPPLTLYAFSGVTPPSTSIQGLQPFSRHMFFSRWILPT